MSQDPFRPLVELLKSQADRFSQALGVPTATRSEVYELLFEESDLKKPFYWLSLLSACGIATLGLAQNSPAVIIGAMLLSPLMIPIVALGLALAIGDVFLGFRSAWACLVSVAASLGVSALVAVLLPFQETTLEILARTRPNPLDLGIALLCGLIAAVSAARLPSAGGGTVLPGVAIAVALVPPLCTAGWGLGAGWRRDVFAGAMILFFTNLAAIVFASLLVFLSIGMATSEETSEIRAFVAEREKGRRVHAWLDSMALTERFRKVGGLGNRVLVSAVAVLILLFPLNSGLKQVKREITLKREAAKAVDRFLPGVTILSRTVSAGQETPSLHLVLLAGATPVEASVREVEKYLEGRLDGPIRVTYTEVASRAAFKETPAAGASTSRFGEMVRALDSGEVARLASLWPGESAGTFLGAAVVAPPGPIRPRIQVRYLSGRRLGQEAAEVLRRGAAALLAVPSDSIQISCFSSTLPSLILRPFPGASDLSTWLAEATARIDEAGVPLSVAPGLALPRGLGARTQAELREAARRVLDELSGVALPGGFLEPTERILEPAEGTAPILEFRLVYRGDAGDVVRPTPVTGSESSRPR
ncbi:MAG: DUF389 domain-containing protein [Acidobacteriota bacterium]